MAELKEWVVKGPDPEKDGVVRWRCVDLRVKIAEQFAVTFHKRSVAKLLSKLDLTRLQPRPYHPKTDAAAQALVEVTRPYKGAAGDQAGSRKLAGSAMRPTLFAPQQTTPDR